MPSVDPANLRERSRFGWTLLTLVAAQVGLHGCLNGMRLTVPLLAVNEAHGSAVIGLLMSLFAVFPFLLAIPAGRLVDRRGYQIATRMGALLSFVGVTVAVLSPEIWALGISASLVGAGSAIGMIALQRTAGRLAHGEAQRLRIFSWVALAPSIATFAGPMLAGLLIDYVSYRAAFVGLALLPIGTLLATTQVPIEAPRAPINSSGAPLKAWDLLANRDLRKMFFINWLIAACWDAHAFALPILGHERGLSASSIAMVLASYAVTSATVRLTIPFLAEYLQPRWLMTVALALTASVFLLYPLLHSAWAMAVCAGIMGLGLGGIQPAVMSSLHTFTPPARQGEALGLRSTVIHFSTLVMPISFGAVGAVLGVAPVFWMTGAALSAGAWAAFGLPSRAKDA